ncbi:chorismate--pyruvate lyase family protein [Azospira restricta]|uniref:Probable chorismate pyruvate-lyase n=1 Tax=Azospira restricta TaxID=404405 RepID=A0A974SRT2_9RHOO|nr:chorismate lyase [Azospira restricta]QRJ65348.1 chorismate lyase [Azospira restricta]
MSGWQCRPRGGIAPALRDWLCEPGSLTARLKRRGAFRIELLRQELRHANADECAALGIRPRTPCWVREVALYCDAQPAIFAHTVLPAAPQGVLGRWFARLGTRSLGSLLFAHPGFVRGGLAFARIDARHPLFAAAVAALGRPPAGFHARRCTHRFGRQTVLVTEVFSPRLGSR